MRYVSALGLGLVVGILGALLGIGGGVFLVPALTEFFRVDQRKAAAISLAALTLPVTLPGVIQYARQGHLQEQDWWIAGCLALTVTLGSYVGATVQASISTTWLQLGFGLLLIFVAVRLIVGSDDAVRAAWLGIATTIVAWLVYLWLRRLGRRHPPRPRSLGEAIATQQPPAADDIGYYI